jgi:hypothetical protein
MERTPSRWGRSEARPRGWTLGFLVSGMPPSPVGVPQTLSQAEQTHSSPPGSIKLFISRGRPLAAVFLTGGEHDDIARKYLSVSGSSAILTDPWLRGRQESVALTCSSIVPGPINPDTSFTANYGYAA